MLRTRVRVGALSGLVLSVLFAALFAAVGAFELFFPAMQPQYGKPTAAVMRVPYGARVVRAGGRLFDFHIEHHRIVIPRGTTLSTLVDDHRAAINYDATRRPVSAARLSSAFVLYLISCLIIINLGQRYGHGRLRLMRSQIGILSLMSLVLICSKVLLLYTTLSPFWAPVSCIALWVTLGFDRRTGLLVDLAAAFIVCSMVNFDVMLLSVLVTRGVVSATLFVNRKQPRQMLLVGLASGLIAAVGYVALTVMVIGSTEGILADVGAGLGSKLLGVVGGGLLAGLLGNVLREPAERALGHVSRGRLLDLTDIESPLLRKMATEAPGSWEHSRAMANLAEAASASIGGDSLLTRVGAYYHDLGKTVQPRYFIENLGGERSPHEDLAPEVSADAIMAHVVVGTKILREGGVPEPVVEFAYTHHGTQLVEYFWSKYLEQHPDEHDRELDEAHFRYPGMKPMTKETAILMLVDSIEAASRTVEPPEHERFEEMIRRVVFTKLASGQLDDSGLTITDLRIMTHRMAATLVNMYHGRIKYPWQRKKEREEALSTRPPEAARPPEVRGDGPAAELLQEERGPEPEPDSEPVPSEPDCGPDSVRDSGAGDELDDEPDSGPARPPALRAHGRAETDPDDAAAGAAKPKE